MPFAQWKAPYLASISDELEKSYERDFFKTQWLEAQNTIEGFYELILNRKADPEGLKNHMQNWALNQSLYHTRNQFLDSEEFKKAIYFKMSSTALTISLVKRPCFPRSSSGVPDSPNESWIPRNLILTG